MYSQSNEQQFILEAFGDFAGNLLDIGACDGRLNSNTLALVERGWWGVLIEPSPRAFLELQKRHGETRSLKLVNAAVGLSNAIVPFWDGSATLGYSTTEDANRAKWDHLARFDKHFYVSQITPEDILREFFSAVSVPDFVSIDTEGTSVDLFLNFPFSERIHPKVVCVEHDSRIQECEEHCRKWAYREVYRSAENLVLVRKY